MKKTQAMILLACMSLMLLLPVAVRAESSGNVVINEIAWMGTPASASDEWIELYNATEQDIDLTGWYIEDDDGVQTYTIGGGTIGANSYFLIEDSEESTSVEADAVIGLSFTNSGDKLVLKNANGDVIDTVNGDGGEWYTGDNTEKRSMERIDPENTDDSGDNWGANIQGNGAVDSEGNSIYGTPGSQNSVTSVAAAGQSTAVSLMLDNENPDSGATVRMSVYASNVEDLFAYGFDIEYDAEVLDFIEAENMDFLNEGGSVETAFQVGLEDGIEGTLIVGEARTMEEKTEVDGSGVLFAVEFQVVGEPGSGTEITVGAGSFLANSENDIIADFEDAALSVGLSVVESVQNLTADEGGNRYEITLNWEAPETGADQYKILKKGTDGEYAELGVTSELSFTDDDNLIPNVEYEYAVMAMKGATESGLVSVTRADSRGITGDNTRSDRVDGRDLENLARHFGETLADEAFDALIDTTYDGSIDGSDLIDIGVNWALTYAG